jgi:hypothetical protein
VKVFLLLYVAHNVSTYRGELFSKRLPYGAPIPAFIKLRPYGEFRITTFMDVERDYIIAWADTRYPEPDNNRNHPLSPQDMDQIKEILIKREWRDCGDDFSEYR